MLQTFVIARGSRDRMLEAFRFSEQASTFATTHPARHRLTLRTLDVMNTLWTVWAVGDYPVFAFRTRDAAEDFVNLNVAARLKQHQATTDMLLFPALSLAGQLEAAHEAIRDEFAIERRFVLKNGNVVREWNMSQSETCFQP